MKMKKELQDDQYKFWDIVIKAISATLTIGTIIIAVVTFLHNQKAEIEQAKLSQTRDIKQKEKDFRKEISEKQLESYTEMSDCLGGLVTVLGYRDSIFTESYYAKKDRFLRLYFGKMNLLESPKADSQIQAFYYLLEQYEADEAGITIQQIRLAAFAINDACRESIMKTWDVQLNGIVK